MEANDNAQRIWMQSRFGRVMDMTRPWKNEIDFREIACTLAYINRYNGCALGEMQVSVALHLLVGLEGCPEELKPWWLLHDGHEYVIGDVTTPTAQAIAAIAEESSRGNGEIVTRALKELKRIHDRRIHEAAGLAMPTAAQKEAIRVLDMRCLNAERRDRLAAEPASWQSESFGTIDCDVSAMWARPVIIADELMCAFRHHLPALKQSEAA